MATPPVLEPIMAQLATELAAMRTANDYSQDVRQCLRQWPNEALIVPASLPMVFLIAGVEHKYIADFQAAAFNAPDVAIGAQRSRLELHVVYLAGCTPAMRETVGRAFAADIERVLVREASMGSGGARTSVWISAIAVGLYVQDIYGNQAGGNSLFYLDYSTKLADPRVGTA